MIKASITMYHQDGSVLIMVILMLILMVSMATSFLSLVGRQLGSAVNIASQTKADVAVMQAQAHVIKAALKGTAATYNSNGDEVPYTTMFNPLWRTEFAAVSDPDGDPFTDDGEPKRVGVTSSLSASTSNVSRDLLVNCPFDLFDMIGGATQTQYSPTYGLAPHMSRRRPDAYNMHVSRWYNVEYMDDEFQHIEIDPSLTEIEKSEIRQGARYVVRYTAQILDGHAMQSINNNFPIVLEDGTSIDPGTDPGEDSLHYIRYQNYLKAYGRSFKSQFGSFDGSQYRCDDYITEDPLDKETVSLFVSGEEADDYYTTAMRLDYDARLRLERAFRGGDLQWTNKNQVLTSNHKGPVQTWGHISESFVGNPLRIGIFRHRSFVPFGGSLRDADLADPKLVLDGVEKPGSVSTPWHINLLSASNITLGRMVSGLSSELRFYARQNQTKLPQIYRQSSANADLFGKSYPEAFPLSLDAGRDVPLYGDGESRTDAQGKFWYNIGHYQRGGGTYVFADASWYGDRQATPGYQNSYWVDIYAALALTLRDARQVWVEEKNLTSGNELLGPDYYEYINGKNNSYIVNNVNDTEEEMLNKILRETYRILGEGQIVAGTPATSKNFFDVSEESLLSGGVNYVGPGSNEFYQFESQLPATANTRAMEYVLNDVMISLFGKANPNFKLDSDDPHSELIAVDFNGDGYAESTVTGWYNPDTKSRYWSWWWDGLGPYVNVSAQNEYMKEPGWYRFDGNGDVLRNEGDEWKSVPDVSKFFEYNRIWLRESNEYPIKPFAKTGRLFIGKSKVIYGFVRGEVYNILKQETMASTDRSFSYRIDPNDDGDYSDSHLLIQTDATLVPDR